MTTKIPIIQPGIYSIHIIDEFHEGEGLIVNDNKINGNENERYIMSQEITPEIEKNYQHLFYFYYDEEDDCYLILSYYSNQCIGLTTKFSNIGDAVMELPINFTSNMKWKIIEINNDKKDFNLDKTLEERAFIIQCKNDGNKIGTNEFTFLFDDEKEEKSENIPNDATILQLDDNFVFTFKFRKYEIDIGPCVTFNAKTDRTII